MDTRRRGPFLLALDQGTTSSRAIVFDARGRALGTGQHALPQIYPAPGHVEHDPEAIWATQRSAWVEAIAAAELTPADIAGIGIANQRETAVVWERATGRPVHHAIVWQDRRTAGACATLAAEGWGPTVAARTGLRLDPYFSATKVAWILDHVTGAREAAARGELLFGTVDAWLLWRLTGGRSHATEATNASRTMLLDIWSLAWDAELLERLGIPRAMLPEVRATCGDFGRSDADVFGAEVPVVAMAGDQQAALFGQGCFSPGGVKNTYGTGCFLLMHAGGREGQGRRGEAGAAVPLPPAAQSSLLRTVAFWDGRGGAEYAVEGSVFSAGSAVEWLREVGLIRRATDAGRLAATVPDAGGAWFVPAFTGLGAPDWDPTARGAVLGLTRGVTRAHLCRAVLEAIAHQTREVFALMCRETGLVPTELRVDGGASRSDLLMQIQADLLGVPVLRPRQPESTAFGAALLAGLGLGVWRDRAEIGRLLPPGRRFVPAGGEAVRARAAAAWRRAVDRSLRWDLQPGTSGAETGTP